MSTPGELELVFNKFAQDDNKHCYKFATLSPTIKKVLDKNWAERVIEAISDGVSIIDTEFKVIHQNKQHRTLFGDCQGKHCYESLWQRQEVCEECPALAAMANATCHSLQRRVQVDGRNRDIEITAAPFRDPTGNIVAAIQVFRDVTERNELTEQLIQAQKMEAIGRMASGLTHDLNNILSAVVGYSEIILSTMPEDHNFREDIQAIHDAGKKASALTKQMLSFCRKQISEKKVASLNDIVRETSQILGLLVGKETEIVLDLQADDNNILADDIQIEQALMNLVVNARDAMSCGGKLFIQTDKLWIDKEQNNGNDIEPGMYHTLTVTDTGCGIPQSIRDKIFTPFFTTKEYGRGSGLGLSIVKDIVDRHKGYVTILNKSCGGASIQLGFPAAQDKPSEKTAMITQSQDFVVQGRTVFVVDKDPDIRKLVCDILHARGYKLKEASCFEKAWEQTNASGEIIDLLICEVMTNDISGFEMADAFQLICPTIKVLFMANDMEDNITQHNDSNTRALFLKKPLVPNILVDRVQKALM